MSEHHFDNSRALRELDHYLTTPPEDPEGMPDITDEEIPDEAFQDNEFEDDEDEDDEED